MSKQLLGNLSNADVQSEQFESRATELVHRFAVTVTSEVPAHWPKAATPVEVRGHIVQMREFLAVWSDTYARHLGAAPRFVEVRDAVGAPLLQVPLAITAKRGALVLTFADHGAADYNAPLLHPALRDLQRAEVQQLWRAIEAALPKVDIVDLEKMPGSIGNRPNPLFCLANMPNAESCHGSDLTRPLDEIEATQAQLKTLRRKLRSLEKLGVVQFTVASTQAERKALLTAALDQKQRRFEETQVPGFAETPQTRDFFEQATSAFAQTDNLRFCALSVDGEIVATSWNVALGTRLYELMIGFAGGEWSKHSSGRILNLMLLKWAKENGYHYLDHGIGDEAWKAENCDTHVPLGRMLAARTPRGRRALAVRKLIGRLRETALYHRLRPWKWIVRRALQRS